MLIPTSPREEGTPPSVVGGPKTTELYSKTMSRSAWMRGHARKRDRRKKPIFCPFEFSFLSLYFSRLGFLLLSPEQALRRRRCHFLELLERGGPCDPNKQLCLLIATYYLLV